MRPGRLPRLIALGAGALLFAELAVLVVVARLIGPGWAVLALLAVSAAGVWLTRRELGAGWRHLQAQPGLPGPLADGAVGAVGALLLAVPGFVTAVVGLLLLVPPGRALARRRLGARLAGLLVLTPWMPGRPGYGRVVDGTVIDGSVVDDGTVDEAGAGRERPGAVLEGPVVDDPGERARRRPPG